MSDPRANSLSSEPTTERLIRGAGLRATLVRSHLAIALLGVGMLAAAFVPLLSLRSTGVRLAERDEPLAWNSMRVLNGLQRSLAGLRGWIALGETSFKEERRRAWEDEIEPSLGTLDELTDTGQDAEQVPRVQRAKELLRDLKEAQWWIEDVAQTPGNMPARVIMTESAEPVGRSLGSAITALLELERWRGGGIQRKWTLARITDLRFSFARCRNTLGKLVFNGGASSRQKLSDNLEIVNDRIESIAANAELLAPDQRVLLGRITDEFSQYMGLCNEVIAIPADDWNVAKHLLATQAAPVASEVSHVLEGIAARYNRAIERTGADFTATSNIGVVMLVLMLMAMAATATVLSIRGARRITHPIRIVAQAARDLGAGRLSEDVPVSTTDELGWLGIAFNEMRGTLREKEDALRESEARMRAIVDSAADGIITIDAEGVVQSLNGAAERIFGYAGSEAIGENVSHMMPSPFREEHDAHLARYRETGVSAILNKQREVIGRRKDGSTFPMDLCVSEVSLGDDRAFTGIVRDITARREAELQLEELHKRVVDASRHAGMAEIATGVLHNVGNVLNSVNVSATVVSDKLRNSKVPSLARATGLMREHASDLGTFITEDEKGKKLPAYLDKLADHLAAEQCSIMDELKGLTKNIEHIKKIVSTQQSHAGAFGVVESVSIAEITDDALTVNATSFERYGITVAREYADLPPISLDKQKLLQIMVNLIRNAKHAVLDCDCENKQLTLRVGRHEDARVRIEVTDNGMGIAANHLTRIFSHGFTTKEDGHGFGLHSAALAAKDMGGSLNVHSDGPTKGATFTLDLPMEHSRAEARVET